MTHLIWILILFVHVTGGQVRIGVTGFEDSYDCAAAMQQIQQAKVLGPNDAVACIKSQLVGKST